MKNKIFTISFLFLTLNFIAQTVDVTFPRYKVTRGFSGNYQTSPDGIINCIEIQSDGKIIVAGLFDTLWSLNDAGGSIGNISASNIIRLNANGSLDTSFQTNFASGFNGEIKSISIESSGKILVGGSFTTFNGVFNGQNLSINRFGIAHLNSNGTLYRDENYPANDFSVFNDGVVHTVASYANGTKSISGGTFTGYNGGYGGNAGKILWFDYSQSYNRDNNFITYPGFNCDACGTVPIGAYKIKMQTDGKFIVSGFFNKYNNQIVKSIIRLNIDGSLDSTFNLDHA